MTCIIWSAALLIRYGGDLLKMLEEYFGVVGMRIECGSVFQMKTLGERMFNVTPVGGGGCM